MGDFLFKFCGLLRKDELYTYRLTIIIFRADGRVQQILEGINISTKTSKLFSCSFMKIQHFSQPNCDNMYKILVSNEFEVSRAPGNLGNDGNTNEAP